jgi:acyl-CoA synthetase (AMP-forming)/AMP-acid ligase II
VVPAAATEVVSNKRIAPEPIAVIQTNNVSPTLDGLFQRILARQPDAVALLDPINKAAITGQAPRRMTFAQADRAISAIAAHFVEAGLPINSVIGVQLPNTVEFMLTVLAAHRAGLIVALLPQLWRQAELTAALNRTGARAVVTMSKIDGVSHADLAMNAAAEAFSIRHVCGFGEDLPEGMAPLDQAMKNGASTDRLVVQDGRKAALVSFDVTTDGFRAVPRTHLNLIAGGLAVFLESRIPQGARLMSAFAPSSFAGLTSSLVLWLLSGGTLALHHPFDSEALERQINECACDALVAPAAMTLRLTDADIAARLPALRHVIGLWRMPEQVASSAQWTTEHARFTDVYLFGEAGLFAARRTDDGAPVPIMPGPHGAPRDIRGTSIAGETLLTPRGTLGLRGPMVTVAAYAPPAPAADSLMTPASPLDYVDTGYAARLDRSSGAICITAPPAGIVAVGGYRFLSQDLQQWAKRLGQGALLTALPDRLCGYRLAGRAHDNARGREALNQLGLNPLMTEAFRDRTIIG